MSTLKVAVITGGHSYEVVPFHNLFRALPGIDAYVQHIDDFTSSRKEERQAYDALVFYTMPGGMPQEKIADFSGRPRSVFEGLGETAQGIVMLHHAILSYPDWPLFDELVGMEKRLVTKYKHDDSIPVEVAAPDHPIAKGVAPWTIVDESYVLHDPGPDSQVILTTNHPASMHTLAWTRTFRGSRVFCYQSGHDHVAFEDPNFQAVLANGIHWAAGRS